MEGGRESFRYRVLDALFVFCWWRKKRRRTNLVNLLPFERLLYGVQVEMQSNMLKISYWKEKESAETLTITKGDADILVSHEPRILDPATNSPVQLSLNMESIDLEQMLQQCLQYNAYTRLKTEFETLRHPKVRVLNRCIYNYPRHD